jgi:TPR repeat protein
MIRLAAPAARLLALACAGWLVPVPAQERPAGRIEVGLLERRAEAGDSAAMRQLAEIHYLGRGGVEQNLTEAARWYEKRARRALELVARGMSTAQIEQAAAQADAWLNGARKLWK